MKNYNAVNSYLNLFINFLFQSRCLECRRNLYQTRLLCPDCSSKLAGCLSQKNKQCEKCGRPLSPFSSSSVCADCLNKKFPYDQLITLGYYEDIIKNLIHYFKFQHRWSLSKIFGRLIQTQFPHTFSGIDYIIPVPLSRKRLAARGYNQAELIAEQISAYTGIPLAGNILYRIKNTPPQSLLTKSEREHNLKNAFFIKIQKEYRHKQFLLVDDVITTGTTVTEASKMLQKLKPNKLIVFALARAL